MYRETTPQLVEDYIVVRALNPGEIYEFKVVSVDGEYLTESAAEEVATYVTGKCQNNEKIFCKEAWESEESKVDKHP